MKTRIHSTLPQEARRIREEVFVREQGFENEFDETDQSASHLILYDGEMPVAVCRFFPGDQPGDYMVGRIAVIKECRGRNLGARLLKEAEKEIRTLGGRRILLHAQCRAAGMKSKGMSAGEKSILMKNALIYGWGRRLGGERA